MKTIAIACGGTGGHLSPGIAVAQRLMERNYRCILLISQKAVDRTLSDLYPQLSFVRIPGIALSKKPLDGLRCLYYAAKNIYCSWQLLRMEQVAAVIGFGGFTNVGAILAAACLRKPCLLHEANQVVGRTIRLFGRLATKVYVPEGVIYNGNSRVSFCGFPLRRELQPMDPKAAKVQLGFDPDKPLVCVVGGSQGAHPLNRWVWEHAEQWVAHGIQVLCITGTNKMVQVDKALSPSIVFKPFCSQMACLYSAADGVIARAGAGTIAELTHFAVPSILIPFPQSAEGHQLNNARVFEQRGGCVVVEQSAMDGLWNQILGLLARNQEMRRALKQLKSIDWASFLADELETQIKR